MKLLGDNKALAQKIARDPDDEPTAGNVPTRVEQLEGALREMMAAYERRVRSDCKTEAQLAAAPWRCLEYVAAESLLSEEERA